ncbi:TetR/AcrR family transcriptional regulator [Rhizobium terrae]|uniref:TetR/AcrR family transcriptional regulator n=1 Tax=Rhizobium terrae TaxID=2171756 RepID=UPI000E3CA0BD|nr:TetR/AcrR family transcriptional regulator [Rhizobium terrae]
MITKVEKEARALRSAEDVFTRYGYARTTMGDIAAAAGMSRPALYLLFPDKDAIFTRVIEEMDRRTLAGIETALREIAPLREKLLYACSVWGLHGMELAAAHPDAADLFDLRFVAVRQVYANFQALLVRLLSDTLAQSDLGATPEDVACAMTYGMRGLRHACSSVEEMRHMIHVHVEAYSKALQATEGVS